MIGGLVCSVIPELGVPFVPLQAVSDNDCILDLQGQLL
jgi:hypothetical protein